MNSAYLSWIFLCLVPACIPKKHIKKVTITKRNFSPPVYRYKTPPITVWVHGTRFIRRPLFYSFFNGKPTIRPAQELDPNEKLYHIAKTLSSNAPDLFPLSTFYFFGWSGKLNSTTRQESAEHLYKELQRVVAEYKQTYQAEPTIRLLTHSHGGTVALNLARVEQDPDNPLKITELVLMACPVQKNTKKFIEADIFVHTCALYSGIDMVQVLAPQVVYTYYRTKKGHLRARFHWPPFSYRRFESHPKLAQVKVKMNGRALFHTEFTSPHFISVLPHVLHVLTHTPSHSPEDDTHLVCIYTRDEEPTSANAPV